MIRLSDKNAVTQTVAYIYGEKNIVRVLFREKREVFRKTVKSLGYSWVSPYWKKEITQYTNDIESCQIELAHRLLCSGFIIEIDDALSQRVIDADYDPECRRWIKRVKGQDVFALSWPYEDDLYSKAMSLPGAYYKPSSVKIPAEQWRELEGFAEVHGFKFSDSAKALLAKAKEKSRETIIVDVLPLPIRHDDKRPKLQASKAIIPNELLDNN